MEGGGGLDEGKPTAAVKAGSPKNEGRGGSSRLVFQPRTGKRESSFKAGGPRLDSLGPGESSLDGRPSDRPAAMAPQGCSGPRRAGSEDFSFSCGRS